MGIVQIARQKQMVKLRIALMLIGVTCAALAFARPQFFDRFKALYSVPKGSVLQRAECKTCHDIDRGPPSLNLFGEKLQVLIDRSNDTASGGVTQDDMIYVENQDADGDGYTNLEEIIAGTLPGLAENYPKVHPTNLPKHKISKKWNPLFLEVTAGLLALGVILLFAGKTAKSVSLGKIGIGLWMLGVLAVVGTFVLYMLSDRHP